MAASYLKAAKMDGGKKSKAEKKADKTTTTAVQYKKYSGVIGEDGKPIDNPSEGQSVKTMVNYMKNNTPESNVYRPDFQHVGVNYNRKKKQTNA